MISLFRRHSLDLYLTLCQLNLLYILEGPLRYLEGPALILGALVSACFLGFGSKDLK